MADGNEERKIEILHPEVWSLSVRLSDKRLQYALYSRLEDNSLIHGTIYYPNTTNNYLKELEAAVYDNNFFLLQYERVQFLVESSHFVLVPDEFSCQGNQQECERYFRFLYPESDETVLVDRIADAGLSVVYGVDSTVEAFLRRTFYNPPVNHFLTPIVKYFRRKDNYGGSKMYVFLNEGKAEVVVMKNRQVVCANYFAYKTVDDAFYFLMNAWKQNGLDPLKHELHIVGDKEVRKQLLPKLREYIANVIQLIFPAQLLRLGKDAMVAPFDLIVLPLCE
jgi:hypothetical protein